jgi:hypothetical protein
MRWKYKMFVQSPPFHVIDTDGIRFAVAELRPDYIRIEFESAGNTLSVYFRDFGFEKTQITLTLADGSVESFGDERDMAAFLQSSGIGLLSAKMEVFSADDELLCKWYPRQSEIFLYPLRIALRRIRGALKEYGV